MFNLAGEDEVVLHIVTEGLFLDQNGKIMILSFPQIADALHVTRSIVDHNIMIAHLSPSC